MNHRNWFHGHWQTVAGLICVCAGILDQCQQDPGDSAAGNRIQEGDVQAFLGNPRFELQPLFVDERFPNVVVSNRGTVLATWGTSSVRARRSEDAGATFGWPHHYTNAIYSDDHGQTWRTSDPFPANGTGEAIYSNCDSPAGRTHGTVWASFDGGKSWPVKRLVFEGNFAYSSLDAGRPETPSAGNIFLRFEGGSRAGSTLARFNLAWIVQGTLTGDGQLPDWLDH